AGRTWSWTSRAPMLRLGSGFSAQNLLEGRHQPLVLVTGADRDPDPAGDRLTIVMADQDLSLAQRGHDLGRRFRRFGEDEIRRRWHELETQGFQPTRQLATIRYHLINHLRVMVFVGDRGGGRDDCQPVDV